MAQGPNITESAVKKQLDIVVTIASKCLKRGCLPEGFFNASSTSSQRKFDAVDSRDTTGLVELWAYMSLSL